MQIIQLQLHHVEIHTNDPSRNVSYYHPKRHHAKLWKSVAQDVFIKQLLAGSEPVKGLICSYTDITGHWPKSLMKSLLSHQSIYM